ncbi:MAG: TolC family protein [Bacteroidales bacterium]
MRIKIFTLLTSLFVSAILSAQTNIEEVLGEIEKNNTTLQALRQATEADKIGNRTDIYLSNPEVEFNYLWGSPAIIGNRKDFSVKQNFDFPSAYSMKSKIADMENNQAELKHKADRISILLTAKQYILDLIYYNGLHAALTTRIADAETLAALYKEKLDKGDGNIIENNKVQLTLANLRNELVRTEIEQENILSELTRLNGGTAIRMATDKYDTAVLPAGGFNEWYAVQEQKNPVLQYVKKQVGISEKQVKLNRALSLPKFSAGYMSENVAGEIFQGISVGVSVPLWENKNKVKQAKARVIADQANAEDTRIQFYGQLQNLYTKAVSLQGLVQRYRSAMENLNNTALLKKALDAGKISLLEYVTELSQYYDITDKTLEAERDYAKTVAELSAVEL